MDNTVKVLDCNYKFRDLVVDDKLTKCLVPVSPEWVFPSRQGDTVKYKTGRYNYFLSYQGGLYHFFNIEKGLPAIFEWKATVNLTKEQMIRVFDDFASAYGLVYVGELKCK